MVVWIIGFCKSGIQIIPNILRSDYFLPFKYLNSPVFGFLLYFLFLFFGFLEGADDAI